MSFHAPGMVFENHTAGDRVEGDAVGPHIAGIFERNPDLQFTGRRLYARDGLVVSEWTATRRTATAGASSGTGSTCFPFENGLILRKDVYSSHDPRRRLVAVSRPRVHEAAGVPAEIERSSPTRSSSSRRRAARTASSSRRRSPSTPRVPRRGGPQLRIVANYAVGLDNIDLEATRERGSS